jgi:hypothetical protein
MEPYKPLIDIKEFKNNADKTNTFRADNENDASTFA